MSKPLRKAIFPVAGLGTRFLPATKTMPKEMLPVVDKPLIQYAVEEARAAGIEEFIFVTGRGKSTVEDHFDHSAELYDALVRRHRVAELEQIINLRSAPGQVVYVRQQEPLGLGHAVWCARNLIEDEPVAVLLADDLIQSSVPCLRQMAEAHERVGGNLVAVTEVPRADTGLYGVIEPGASDGQLIEVKGVVEKPAPSAAPSAMAIVGRYILQPAVFGALGRQRPGAGGEIQLTDALAAMIGHSPLRGFRFEGRRFDCGDKAGFFEANVAYALRHPVIGEAARRTIRRYAEGLDAGETTAA